jgi:signal peptidase I
MSDQILEINRLDFEVLARQILAENRSIRFRARGSSMRPFIKDGDILLVEPVREDRIRVGDIVLFGDRKGAVLAHRVIRIDQRGESIQFLVSGDANRATDGLIPLEHVMGRVVSLEREGHRRNINHPFMRLTSLVWVKLSAIIKPVFFYLAGTEFYQTLRRNRREDAGD